MHSKFCFAGAILWSFVALGEKKISSNVYKTHFFPTTFSRNPFPWHIKLCTIPTVRINVNAKPWAKLKEATTKCSKWNLKLLKDWPISFSDFAFAETTTTKRKTERYTHTEFTICFTNCSDVFKFILFWNICKCILEGDRFLGKRRDFCVVLWTRVQASERRHTYKPTRNR